MLAFDRPQEEELIVSAQRYGFTGEYFRFRAGDTPCLIIDSIQQRERGGYSSPASIAFAEKWGFSKRDVREAAAFSFENIVAERVCGDGKVFLAGNEYGNFFVGYTLNL